MSKVSMGHAVYLRRCQSGKSFMAKTDDHGEINIPDWAVHDDSEVWKPGDEGELIVLEKWAEDKGYA